jgi:hypothetical protein
MGLGCGDAFVKLAPTAADGTFSYPEADGHECVFLRVQFGWFATSPRSVEIDVPPGGEVDVLFLVRHVGEDVSRFGGWAIVDGMRAPTTVVLDAWVDGVSCGDGILSESIGRTGYQLYVLGESERPGCAAPGDTVLFTLDGVPSGIETFTVGESESLDLISGPVPMYFSFSYSSMSTQGAVEATIDGHQCGEGVLFSTIPFSPPNQQSVIVRAAASAAGCGAGGKVVNLQVGEEVVGQVLWREGQVLDGLQHLGDADCDARATSIDAALILQYQAQLAVTLDCFAGSDVTREGLVNAVDAALVLQLEAELIDHFP